MEYTSKKNLKKNFGRLLVAQTYAPRVIKGQKRKRRPTEYNRSSQVYNVRGGFW